jgi:hypothetical protein
MFCLAAVVLVGGTVNGTGNVYARNPTTGVYGPVCDDLWDLSDVCIVLYCKFIRPSTFNIIIN